MLCKCYKSCLNVCEIDHDHRAGDCWVLFFLLFRHVNDRGLGGGTMDGPLRRVIDALSISLSFFSPAPIKGGSRDFTGSHKQNTGRER